MKVIRPLVWLSCRFTPSYYATSYHAGAEPGHTSVSSPYYQKHQLLTRNHPPPSKTQPVRHRLWAYKEILLIDPVKITKHISKISMQANHKNKLSRWIRIEIYVPLISDAVDQGEEPRSGSRVQFKCNYHHHHTRILPKRLEPASTCQTCRNQHRLIDSVRFYQMLLKRVT